MSWSADYGWLHHFWDEVVPDRPERVWQVTGLFDRDLWLRDAYAWGLLRDRLRDRGARVQHAHVRAWTDELEIPFKEMAKRDLIFLGRTKAFASSRLAPYAYHLGSNIRARFDDPFDGRLGNSLMYGDGDGKRIFTRHDLDRAPGQYRRTDVDYAVLAFLTTNVGFEERRLLAISGISTLGTLALTLALVDDTRRGELVHQARELGPPDAGLRPGERFEICVRVTVDGERGLADFLNRPEFATTVEVVAIGDREPHIREEATELVLRPGTGGRRGTVSVRGMAALPIAPKSFNLLRCLVEHDGVATDEELSRDLEKPLDGKTEATVRQIKGTLAKRAYDLNVALGRLQGLHQTRPVQKREGRYVLTGVRGVIRP